MINKVIKTKFKGLHLVRLLDLAMHVSQLETYTEHDIKIELSTADFENNKVQISKALSECPIVFDEWIFKMKWDEVHYLPQLLDTFPNRYEAGDILSGIRFFQLTPQEFSLLFVPGRQINESLFHGYKNLMPDSKPSVQSHNLYKFIEQKAASMSVKIQIPHLS
jgi:hypothetical protein